MSSASHVAILAVSNPRHVGASEATPRHPPRLYPRRGILHQQMHKTKQKRYISPSFPSPSNSNSLAVEGDRLTSKEFVEISRAVGVGFLLMGFLGFAVKLINIPINNILVFFCSMGLC